MLRNETAAEPRRMAQALAGLRAYQQAPRPSPPAPMPPIAGMRGAALRDYGGIGPPVVFIPSLINPPYVLDLGERSLLRWLAGHDRRVLLLDWGGDVSQRRDLSVSGHVEQIALPLLQALGEPAALAGYCLGGTMAVALAAVAQVERLVLIAAPWRFSGYGDATAPLGRLWSESKPLAEQLGVLPMEALQSAFWNLDPARTIGKYQAFASLDPDGAAAREFVTLEDWANDGPPIPTAAARELFEDFFAADRPGSGGWTVAEKRIDPAALGCPILDIVSTTDRIVPAASSIGLGERIELTPGHVGMVVGSRAKAALWEPLASWLSQSSP